MLQHCEFSFLSVVRTLIGAFCSDYQRFCSFAAASPRDPDGNTQAEKQEEGLTAVLYPHRMIKITDLVKPGGSGQPTVASVQDVQDVSIVDNEQQRDLMVDVSLAQRRLWS